MSDACFEGYTCHGKLIAVRLHDLVNPDAPVARVDRVVAWLCSCGVWRHATSPIHDQALRAVVTVRMEALVRERAGEPHHR